MTTTDTLDEACTRFEQIAEKVNALPDLVRRGRFLSMTLLVGIGPANYYVSIDAGRISAVERGPKLTATTALAVKAEPDVWLKFWEPIPAPGWNDLSALVKLKRATLDGDFRLFMANLQYIKDVLASPRQQQS
jgi:hypothetical protein